MHPYIPTYTMYVMYITPNGTKYKEFHVIKPIMFSFNMIHEIYYIEYLCMLHHQHMNKGIDLEPP